MDRERNVNGWSVLYTCAMHRFDCSITKECLETVISKCETALRIHILVPNTLNNRIKGHWEKWVTLGQELGIYKVILGHLLFQKVIQCYQIKNTIALFQNTNNPPIISTHTDWDCQSDIMYQLEEFPEAIVATIWTIAKSLFQIIT